MRSLRCNGGSPYYGYNVDFIAQYLYEHPGAGMTEVRRALALSRGMPKLPDGWMTDYFYHNRKYYTSYAGVLWERVDPENRRRGWKLTLEGYGRVKNS